MNRGGGKLSPRFFCARRAAQDRFSYRSVTDRKDRPEGLSTGFEHPTNLSVEKVYSCGLLVGKLWISELQPSCPVDYLLVTCELLIGNRTPVRCLQNRLYWAVTPLPM